MLLLAGDSGPTHSIVFDGEDYEEFHENLRTTVWVREPLKFASLFLLASCVTALLSVFPLPLFSHV
jgi:hypothetical protein